MIVVQIIKSLAGFPSKMKAHLFSEVYNLVVNVSFWAKTSQIGFLPGTHHCFAGEEWPPCGPAASIHSAWRGSSWPALLPIWRQQPVCWAEPDMRRQEALGLDWLHQLPSPGPPMKWAGSTLTLTHTCYGTS